MATILVVDDNLLDQRVAGGHVSALGHRPIYAKNGREALEVIEKAKPDVVLTDVQMPELNGLQLVQKVRIHHPEIPVMLMTAFGSEDIAALALKGGAASFVAKKNLRLDLGGALAKILAAVEAARQREHVRHFLVESESRFALGYETGGPQSLISYLHDGLARLDFCDQTGLYQVTTALAEALSNAIEHGNLELDSRLYEKSVYEYKRLRLERTTTAEPYCHRRVHVTSRLTPAEAVYVIRDEGPGFEPSKLPHPANPVLLTDTEKRGVTLIRAFMDEVRYNAAGNEITLVKRHQHS